MVIPKNKKQNEENFKTIKDIIIKNHGDMIVKDQDMIILPENSINTGSLQLDNLLGGGIPRGVICEFYGIESSCKTTLALHCIREEQKKGNECAFIDIEFALNDIYTRKLGVNMENLIISRPEYGEQCWDYIGELLEMQKQNQGKTKLSLIVVDSLAVMIPKNELEGEMLDNSIGSHARLTSKGLKKIVGIASTAKVTVIFINQIREKMSLGFSMGPTITSTGGHAMKFFPSLRLEFAKRQMIKDTNNTPIGTYFNVKVAKSKICSPLQNVEIPLMFNSGINECEEIVLIALNKDILQKSGTWISYKGNNIGQGVLNAQKYISENTDILNEIKAKIKN